MQKKSYSTKSDNTPKIEKKKRKEKEQFEMMLSLISVRGMQTCSGLVDRYIVEQYGNIEIIWV